MSRREIFSLDRHYTRMWTFYDMPSIRIRFMICYQQITVDAICVLADLSYSFLTDECPPKHTEPLWLETLGHLSLAITSIFLAEIALALYAFGISFYNPLGTVIHASLHLLDAAVIIGTFVIEVFLRGRERELASLLILVRLWRLVKLVGGQSSLTL